MIELKRAKNGIEMPTYVPPPLATKTGEYPTKVLGAKLTPFGIAVQRGEAVAK